jgi:hypothetical protein
MTKKPSCAVQSLKNRVLFEWTLLKVRVYLRVYAAWIFLKALKKSYKYKGAGKV